MILPLTLEMQVHDLKDGVLHFRNQRYLSQQECEVKNQSERLKEKINESACLLKLCLSPDSANNNNINVGEKNSTAGPPCNDERINTMLSL